MADTPITVDCKSCSATWETTASYRSAVICPACGERRYIGRADRARPLPQWSDDGEPGPEPDADGQAGEPGYVCPECGAGMAWVGARTALECPECGHWQASPQSAERAGNRMATIARGKAASDKPSGFTVRELTAHMELLAERQTLIAALQQLAEIFNPVYIPAAYTAYVAPIYARCMAAAETVRVKVTDRESLDAMITVSRQLHDSLASDITNFRRIRAMAGSGPVQVQVMQNAVKAIDGKPSDYQQYDNEDTDDDFDNGAYSDDSIYKKPASLKTRLIRIGIFAGLSAMAIASIVSGKPITNVAPQSAVSELEKAVIDRASRTWG